MKRYFNLMFVLLVGLFMVGCGPSATVTKKEYVFFDIEPRLVARVKPTPPPDRDTYVGDPATPIAERVNKRNTLLLDYVKDLHTDLDACNRRLGAVEEFSFFTKTRIEKLNKELKK